MLIKKQKTFEKRDRKRHAMPHIEIGLSLQKQKRRIIQPATVADTCILAP
jgi:hypothetical protein